MSAKKFRVKFNYFTNFYPLHLDLGDNCYSTGLNTRPTENYRIIYHATFILVLAWKFTTLSFPYL